MMNIRITVIMLIIGLILGLITSSCATTSIRDRDNDTNVTLDGVALIRSMQATITLVEAMLDWLVDNVEMSPDYVQYIDNAHYHLRNLRIALTALETFFVFSATN